MDNDIISRQAAIDAVEKESQVDGAYGYMDTKSIVDLLNDLPSAQRKGRWIIVTDSRGRHAECPYCGEWKYHSKQKFCGECGARMEVQE